MNPKEMSDQDYAKFFGPEGVWRNDDHPELHGESSTASTLVINATDDTSVTGEYFRLRIRHVRGFHGRGFMPNLVHHSSRESAGNGDVFYGTDRAACGRAVEAGRQMCQRRNATLAANLAKMRREYEEHVKATTPTAKEDQ